MEKAYDLKELGRKIVAKANLKLSEEALEAIGKGAYDGFKEWFKESAVLTDTKIDDVASSFLVYADPYVLPQIEKIDLDHDGK